MSCNYTVSGNYLCNNTIENFTDSLSQSESNCESYEYSTNYGCLQKEPEGEFCWEPKMCLSGVCNNYSCTAPSSDDPKPPLKCNYDEFANENNVCEKRNTRGLGSYCENKSDSNENNYCANTLDTSCYNNKCRKKGTVNDSCNSREDCDWSFECNNSTKKCSCESGEFYNSNYDSCDTKKKEDDYCKNDDECAGDLKCKHYTKYAGTKDSKKCKRHDFPEPTYAPYTEWSKCKSGTEKCTRERSCTNHSHCTGYNFEEDNNCDHVQYCKGCPSLDNLLQISGYTFKDKSKFDEYDIDQEFTVNNDDIEVLCPDNSEKALTVEDDKDKRYLFSYSSKLFECEQGKELVNLIPFLKCEYQDDETYKCTKDVYHRCVPLENYPYYNETHPNSLNNKEKNKKRVELQNQLKGEIDKMSPIFGLAYKSLINPNYPGFVDNRNDHFKKISNSYVSIRNKNNVNTKNNETYYFCNDFINDPSDEKIKQACEIKWDETTPGYSQHSGNKCIGPSRCRLPSWKQNQQKNTLDNLNLLIQEKIDESKKNGPLLNMLSSYLPETQKTRLDKVLEKNL